MSGVLAKALILAEVALFPFRLGLLPQFRVPTCARADADRYGDDGWANLAGAASTAPG